MAMMRNGGMRVYADGSTIYFDRGAGQVIMCDALASWELAHERNAEYGFTEDGYTFETFCTPTYRVTLECMGFRFVNGSLPEITKDMLGKMSVRDLFGVIERKIEGRA
jgi:hypothetical protein